MPIKKLAQAVLMFPSCDNIQSGTHSIAKRVFHKYAIICGKVLKVFHSIPSSFPQPCVYCQLDEEDSERDEVYFVPETTEECSLLYYSYILYFTCIHSTGDI